MRVSRTKRAFLTSGALVAGLAFSLGAEAMTAADKTAVAAQAARSLVPFSTFLADLKKSDSVSRLAMAAAPQDAEEMRQYLLKRYDGVAVRRSFISGDQTFDCIPTADQPALRGKGPVAIATPPALRPSQVGIGNTDGPAADSRAAMVDSGESCAAGTVPIRRISTDEIARFGTLKRFFAKDLSDAAPGQPGLAGTWVGTETQPGSPTPKQDIALTLNPVGAGGTISGNSTQSDSANPDSSASATLSGTVSGNIVTLDQKGFYLQTPQAGLRWCLAHAKLTYSAAGGVPTLTGNLSSAGCEPAEVHMTKAAATSHKYATHGIALTNWGGVSTLAIWKPLIRTALGQVFSLSQEWYSGGNGASLQTAEVGWQVYPQKYGTTKPVFFSYYTADDYKNTGCYNTDCGAYVQSDKTIAPGKPFSKWGASGANSQYSVTTGYYLNKGNWWLSQGDSWIGYYPASLYKGGQMARNADFIEFGGEVVGAGNWPAMGSGRFPAATNAAFQKDIVYRGSAGGTHVPPAMNYSVVTSPSCYREGRHVRAGSYFYFGGPGGTGC